MARGGQGNLSEAIRKALVVFGADSDRDKTQKIKQWIKQHYPALSRKVGDKNFGPTLSSSFSSGVCSLASILGSLGKKHHAAYGSDQE
jgi:hypothetical protein